MPADPSTRHSLLETLVLAQACERSLGALGEPGARAARRFADGVLAAAALALGPEGLLLADGAQAAALLARGAEPARLMADALGRSGGYAPAGRAKSAATGLGAVVAESPDAAVALSAAIAAARAAGRDSGRRPATLVAFDDEAVDAAVLAAAMRFAAAHRAPLLFVCRASVAAAHAAGAARRVGLPSGEVAADDAAQLWQATEDAIVAIHREGGPRLLLRAAAHAADDPQAYAEAEWRFEQARHDPVKRLTRQLIDDGVIGPGELLHLHQRADAQARAACLQASKAPGPARRAALPFAA